MQKNYYTNPYKSFLYEYPQQNQERFIGPIFPFLGGALIGYIAGRPQYNYSYPVYYPYIPYYPNYYYQNPNSINYNNYTVPNNMIN